MIKILLLILSFTFTLSLYATTYYVSSTGNDSHAGTSALPFKSIQKGINIVVAGDSVIVKDGTYTASNSTYLLLINKSGTSTNQIVVKSQNQYGAILDGQNIIPYGIILYAGASNVKVEGFEIKNFRKHGIIYNQPEISSYVTIQGNKIHEIGRYDSTDSYGLNAIYFKNKSHHWTITRNIFYNIGRTGPDTYWMNKDHAIYIGATDTPENAAHHNIISYNIIWGVSGTAITNGGNNDQIVNNIFAWTNENSQGGTCFIAPDSNVADLLVANNIFYQPPVKNPYAIAPLGNIIRWTIKNNIVYGGRMWVRTTDQTIASMAGSNFGQTDCENAEVNPLFISAIRANAPNVDFRLQPNSPAINKGVNVGLTTDYSGNSIVGLPDISVYECNSSNPTAITLTATAGTITTYGGTTTLTANATGGTPPYTYSLNGGTYQSGNTFTVTAGTYTVTVKDGIGNSATSNTVKVTQPTQNITSTATYYVSKTGSNSNPGTLTQPWLTLTYAESKMKSGDDLYIRAGIYNEQLRIWGIGGTAQNPTTFQNYNDEKVIIDGSGLTIGAGGGLVHASGDYIQISGIEVSNSSLTGMILDATCNNSRIDNCISKNSVQTGIGVYSNYSYITNCQVFNNCLSNSDGIFSSGEAWGAGINLRYGFCSVARNNLVYDNFGEGLSCAQAEKDTIEGNTVYDNFSVNTYLMNSIGCVFTKNRVFMTKSKGKDALSIGFAIGNEAYLGSHYNDNNTIAYNIIYNCRRNFYAYEPLTNCKIVNNTFINSTAYYNVQFNRNISDNNSIFKNNIIIQDDTLPCIYSISGTGVTFSNNLYNKSYDIDVKGVKDIIGDPLFVDKSNRNFRLQSNSPAINAGVIVGLTTDYSGNTIVGLTDIGAYEYNSSNPTIITVTATSGTILTYGGTTTLTVNATGGTAPYTYSLNGGVYQSGNTYTVTAETYTVTVKDGTGNIATSNTVTVTQPTQTGLKSAEIIRPVLTVEPDTNEFFLPEDQTCTMVIPNGFSPNGDGINDLFKISCMNAYPDARISIFNTTSQQVFQKSKYGNVDYWGTEQDAWWDGTDNVRNAGTKLPTGTYLYILELDKGVISLVKKATIFISY